MRQLIFDCDGVLIDSEIIAAEVMVSLLNKHGIPITISYYLENCTGKTFTGLKNSLSAEHQVELPENFIPLVTEQMELSKSKKLMPIVGMDKLLENLLDIPKAVVSNSDGYQINNALDKVNIAHHFGEKIYSSELVKYPKPSPEIYLYAADKLGVISKDCLVIEDSVSGATAALTAGMEVVGFLAGSHIVKGHENRLREIGVERLVFTAKELEREILGSI